MVSLFESLQFTSEASEFWKNEWLDDVPKVEKVTVNLGNLVDPLFPRRLNDS